MECLRSWITQDYPGPTQILFGVASTSDPVCGTVRQLIAENPKFDSQLVITSEVLGVNGKVSNLIQLRRQAKHGIIAVSDGDVFVPPDFFRNVVAPFQEPKVGLVNCFYRLANPSTAAMHWESVAINADFWSQVLQGRTIEPLDFALGAVMVTRSADLEKIGGFESLADFLADDFQLGNRIVRVAKKSIALSPVVVDCRSPAMDWAEVWSHQLRWARTIRVCKPLPYALSILSNPTLWPLLLAAVFPMQETLLALVFCLIARMSLAQSLQQRLGSVPGQASFFWLAPVKDILQVGLWAAAFLGKNIVWRGQRYTLRRDGFLVRD